LTEEEYVEIREIPGVGKVEFKPELTFEKVLCLNGASYCEEVLYDFVKHETLMKLIDKAEYVYEFTESRNLSSASFPRTVPLFKGVSLCLMVRSFV